MKFWFGILVLIPKLLAAPPDESTAKFHWTDCPSDETADQCLKVDFPADQTDDIALLNYVDGEVTILSGFLMKDQKSAVSVTMYEDHLEVTMHSPHDDGHSMFRVDMMTGETTAVDMPDDIIFDSSPIAPDEINNGTMTMPERDITSRFVPATGYNLRVAVFYDDNFKNFNGGSTSASETRINSIFNHVKTLYTQLTVSGVSGAIKPSLQSINYRSGAWSADSSLGTCSWISNGLQWDVDEHVYLTYNGGASGIVGIAWLRSTCSIYQYYRSNVNEWFSSDTVTAQIVAHEIGHNLGMFHDFNNDRSARYYNGQACTNIGGYMDYTRTPTRWSPCSVADFTSYYSAVSASRPNDGVRPSSPFCLVASTSSPTPNTCVADCVASWTGGSTTCVKTDACTLACNAGTCT